MKKAYNKPALYTQKLENSNIIRTCSDADKYWIADDTEYEDEGALNGSTIVVFIPNDMPNCDMTEVDFMTNYGNNNGYGDGPCYYASTFDGITYNS